jgi:hypothetical protein
MDRRRELRRRRRRSGSGESVDLLTGLLAYYRLDGALTDSSGNGRDLTPPGDETYGAGVLGQALAGGSAATVAVSVPVTDFSLACWIKLTSHGSIVASQSAFGIQQADTTVILQVAGQGGAGASAMKVRVAALGEPNITLSGLSNGWHHVAAVCSGGVLTVYRNGVSAGTGNAPAATTAEIISAVAPTSFGLLDECGFYSLALSAAQVAALYNGGDGFDPTA